MTAVHRRAPDHDRDISTLQPDALEDAGRGHDFDDVEERTDGFVLRCTCGWASEPSRSAEVVGTAWDRHRSEVGVSDW
jgi:hypothetical protein